MSIYDFDDYLYEDRRTNRNPCPPKPCPPKPRPCCCIGPTGPVGTILGSYETLCDLIIAHPTGNQGDAYLVGGDLYVWSTDDNRWRLTGNLMGPAGAPGVTIRDSYDRYEDFVAEHPTGNAGDAYLVAGELFVWSVELGTWVSMGSIMGPTGPTGATGAGVDVLGVYRTLRELIAAHPTGRPGEAYIVNGTIYVWDTGTNTWQAAGPVGATGATAPTI